MVLAHGCAGTYWVKQGRKEKKNYTQRKEFHEKKNPTLKGLT